MGDRAIVLGAGVAGLLTANVLSPSFGEVLLVDQGLDSQVATRKGAPQVHHAHVLLARGAQILEEMFPGLFDELMARGGLQLDMSGANNWFHFGTWKRRFSSGVQVHFQSRILLEEALRARVLKLRNVKVVSSHVHEVDWFEATPRVLLGDQWTRASLLVDASGRGSKMPVWLEKAAYQSPTETEVPVRVTYTSARFRARVAPDWGGLLVYPTPPQEKRAGGALPIEGGERIVSLFGWCGEKAEPNDADYLDFARSLPAPTLADFIENSDRVSDYSVYQYKTARIRHYDRLSRFPPNTLVLGDALCSLDPVFGQGMTISALAVTELARLIRREPQDLAYVANEFRRRAPSSYANAWQLSTSEDFRFAEIAGQRPPGTKFTHWYTGHVHRLTSVDEDVARRFARVMNLLEPPTHLMHPRVLFRVLGNWLAPTGNRLERPETVEQ